MLRLYVPVGIISIVLQANCSNLIPRRLALQPPAAVPAATAPAVTAAAVDGGEAVGAAQAAALLAIDARCMPGMEGGPLCCRQAVF
jgi:hypothetical protein